MTTLIRDQFDPPAFEAYQSLGLVFVRELGPNTDGESDQILHGPFNDFSDAFIEMDRPVQWRVV